MVIPKEIGNIPSTRYQGSKRKILPWIYDCIKDVEFNTVLDVFGGSYSRDLLELLPHNLKQKGVL